MGNMRMAMAIVVLSLTAGCASARLALRPGDGVSYPEYDTWWRK